MVTPLFFDVLDVINNCAKFFLFPWIRNRKFLSNGKYSVHISQVRRTLYCQTEAKRLLASPFGHDLAIVCTCVDLRPVWSRSNLHAS